MYMYMEMSSDTTRKYSVSSRLYHY